MDGNYLQVKGVREPVLNVASYDFLGMSQEASIKTKAVEALDYYGCGSCGPRGFYGTIDVHLNFEHNIAKFMGTEVRFATLFACAPISPHYLFPRYVAHSNCRKRSPTRTAHPP